MPRITLNGTHIHYTDTGGDAPAIVFSHGLLMNGEMFDAQIAHFQNRYRCITFDHLGQGRSNVPETGYDMATLTEDAAALITFLGVGPCHFVGLSMGAFIGIRLAAQKPHLLQTLTLLGSSSEPETTSNVLKYRMPNIIARWIGLWAVVGSVMPIIFGQSFLHDNARVAQRKRWKKAISHNHKVGITRAVSGVITRDGCADLLEKITIPVGIGVGDEDVATDIQKSERMHAAISDSTLDVFAGAGHSSAIETPNLVNNLIEHTLKRSEL